MLQKLFPAKSAQPSHIQSRLLSLSALFMLVYALILTLSPAVRQHSLQVDYLWVHWISVIIWIFGFSQIHKRILNQDIKFDPLILPIISLLIGWGVLSIFRISIYFGIRQTVWMMLGMLLLYFGTGRKDLLDSLYRYKYVWITLGIFLMALTLIFGTYPGGIGPELWLGGYGFYFQPSEVLKILIIVYLAAYFSGFSPSTLTNTRLLLPTVFIIGIASGILIFQKDLGTASIILLVYMLFVYMATQKRKMLLFGGIILAIASAVGYSLFSVIQIRLSAWLNPWQDAANTSYQIIQSLISVASGGIFGSGPGIGNPSVVPVSHSDFIFASILEETGLIGGTVLVILLMILFHRVIKISLGAKNKYQRMLGSGLIIYLILQSILIMGGNLSFLPLTGVTLPFVSYGGSSLLSSIFAVLIWQHIAAESSSIAPTEILSIRSILIIETTLLVGLSIIWVFAMRWGLLQSGQLTQRADNPRNAIADSYVARGKIVDRNNKILVETKGTSGNYERVISNPALIQLTGYSNSNYGQSNLESSLNNYLRGLSANRSSEIFWNNLLYSQHPKGLNVRLTIDLEIQTYADTLLEKHTGAIILMNPVNGEIFALSSYPYVSNENGDLLAAITAESENPQLPLLNRAVHGLYPPGTAISPFLYHWQAAENINPIMPKQEAYDCLIHKANITSWDQIFANGCEESYPALSKSISAQIWQNLLNNYHFLEEPVFPLAQAELQPFKYDENQETLSLQELPLITPLQMAVAASIFSTQDTLAAPVLSYAVETPHQGWVVLPKNSPQPLDMTAPLNNDDFLNPQKQNFWVFMGKANRDDGPVTWYVSGTTKYWNGMPLMVVVLLEQKSAHTAKYIGDDLLFHALQLK